MSAFFSGVWYNELGSEMQLSASGGQVSGIYMTSVGYASGDYTISGRYNETPSSGGQALGWAVAWDNPYINSHSATAWSGQYQTDPTTNAEEIGTFWLLTSETDPDDDWAATQIGQDTFTRQKPTSDAIEKARKGRAASHPVRKPPTVKTDTR